MWYQFRPYVSVAQRRAQAAREIAHRRKNGQTVTPVLIEGRTIAKTFWGKSWCENLEAYSDYENRLPRGRTYVRNGSVVDLKIQPGKITALVSGSELYEVAITIAPVPEKQWHGIKSRTSGAISSVIELLQGRLSKGVMDVVTAREGGLFPKPNEIKLSCSCPDWAGMCKHVAAVMYGVGARLDRQPELLFVLRKVDHLELIEEAVPRAGKTAAAGKKTLAESELAGVFGIELAEPEATGSKTTAKSGKRAARASERPAPKRRGGTHSIQSTSSATTEASGSIRSGQRGRGLAGESVSGYFRKLFREDPKLLTARSNDRLLARWLADHPEQTEVPPNVKANLANVKSVLRRLAPR